MTSTTTASDTATAPTHGSLVTIEPLSGGIVLLRLGQPGEKVVTLTLERMGELKSALQQIKRERPKGLIVTGPGEEMFTAGADVNLIRDVKSAADAERFAAEGQAVFGMIESLGIPTVAAISGPCVGGGCELALACTYRIISDHPASIIGLPETKLGIIPGFGGTQRMPRLVGIRPGLDIILAGKTLKPEPALKRGLVDAVVPFSQLLVQAERLVRENRPRTKLPFTERLLTFTRLGRWIVRRGAVPAMKKQTRGNYPAPPAALDAVFHGLSRGMADGLQREAALLGKMIVTPECKALVRIFFLTEASKGLGKAARKEVEGLTALVVGAGVMGAGIASSFARNGVSVLVRDTSDESLRRGRQHVDAELASVKYLKDHERAQIASRIEWSTGVSTRIREAKVAVEAIFEDLNVKRALLEELSSLLPEEAILATNTSSLALADLASAAKNPTRFAGMHFFNPVEKMPLVEVVQGPETSDRVLVTLCALCTKIGKFPVIVRDVPGFLVNRILAPYLNEALFLLEEGYAAQDIDKAAQNFGMAMGPIRVLDEVGLDIAAKASDILQRAYGARFQSAGFSKKLVDAKRLGKKTGAGFYAYKDGKAEPEPRLRDILGLPPTDPKKSDWQVPATRLTLALVNEAVRCFDEGVAGTPSAEAASQIDLATVMGMGFPPFRGGLLSYADSLGAYQLLQMLQRAHATHGKRFEPAPGIVSRAEHRGSFLVSYPRSSVT